MPELEDVLGLHQEITIIYVVDGYEATLTHEVVFQPEYRGMGATIIEAIEDLRKNVREGKACAERGV